MLGSLATTKMLCGSPIARVNISQFYLIKINQRVQMIIDVAEFTPKELFFVI